MICTTLCAGDTTIPSIADILCGQIQPRDEKKSKLFIARCDVSIPTGIPSAIAASLTTLLAAGKIGASGKLKNFLFGDPQTAEQSFADCDPATQIITGRSLTFEDWNAFQTLDDEDPEIVLDEYADRTFWRTIKADGKYNWGYTTCDGKLYLFTNVPGTAFMTGTLTLIKGEDRSAANYVYEVKKGTINFLGDPEETLPAPYIDLSEHLVANPTLASLY